MVSTKKKIENTYLIKQAIGLLALRLSKVENNYHEW